MVQVKSHLFFCLNSVNLSKGFEKVKTYLLYQKVFFSLPNPVQTFAISYTPVSENAAGFKLNSFGEKLNIILKEKA